MAGETISHDGVERHVRFLPHDHDGSVASLQFFQPVVYDASSGRTTQRILSMPSGHIVLEWTIVSVKSDIRKDESIISDKTAVVGEDGEIIISASDQTARLSFTRIVD